MRLLLTAVIFLAGLAYLVTGIGFLFNPQVSGGGFGLNAVDSSGLAAIRADFTAFFVVSAICMLWGAWKRNGDILLVPAALFFVAFIGRLISAIADGRVDDFWVPMVVEAATVIVCLIASRMLPHREEGLISDL